MTKRSSKKRTSKNPAGKRLRKRATRRMNPSIVNPEDVLEATRLAWGNAIETLEGKRPTRKALAEAIWLDTKGNWKPGFVLITTETGLIPSMEEYESAWAMWEAAQDQLQKLLDDEGVYFEHLNSAVSYVEVPGWEDRGWYTVAGKHVKR
jgi:hypothetical protein